LEQFALPEAFPKRAAGGDSLDEREDLAAFRLVYRGGRSGFHRVTCQSGISCRQRISIDQGLRLGALEDMLV
jgi:hypothetical protein